MFIGEKELYSPLHLLWVRFLRPNFCSDPNFFSGPKIFKTQKGSWPKFFWTIILLLTKNNLFINQHFFTQNFLGPNAGCPHSTEKVLGVGILAFSPKKSEKGIPFRVKEEFWSNVECITSNDDCISRFACLIHSFHYQPNTEGKGVAVLYVHIRSGVT